MGKNSTFTENKSMDSGSGDAGQRKTNHASKAHAKKQMYRNTSGQKVQKSDAKPGQEEKTDFVKESRTQLSLNVYQKNTRAIHFYQREGFEIQNEGLDEATGEKDYIMTWR